MCLDFMSFFFDFHDSGVGEGVLLSWLEFFLFVDVRDSSFCQDTIHAPACKQAGRISPTPRYDDGLWIV